MDRSRRYLLALPMFHIAGLVNMFSCFASGCDSIVIPLPKPDPILHAIAVQKINTVALPATVWVGLLQLPNIDTAHLSRLTHPFFFQSLPTPVLPPSRHLAPNAT